jgi:hypothetical protein
MSGATEVRLKVDTTKVGQADATRVRLKADATT